MSNLIRYGVPRWSRQASGEGSRLVGPRVAARTYYVSNSGSDAADGLTTGTPWQTVTKVNATTLNTGDTILFNGGQTFTGKIYVTTSGTAGLPITFGSYGTGRATISASADNSIYVYNAAGIEIRNLICVPTGTAFAAGAGVQFYCDGSTRRDHIVIDNVDCTAFQNGISIGSGATGAGYSDVTVSNSTLHANRDNGLITYGPTYNVGSPFYAVQGLTVSNVQAYSNLGNTGNTTSASGFGMALGSVDNTSTGAGVSLCTAYSNGSSNGCTTIGPVGIIVYNSTGVTIAQSLAYSNRTGASQTVDGEGIDLDINCINCTIDRCLAYDNTGAGLLLFGSSGNSVHTGCVIRHSLSWGNGRNTLTAAYWGDMKLAGNIANAQIYHNTVVARDTSGATTSAFNVDATPSGVVVRNNIFYGATNPAVVATTAWSTAQCLMQGNDYYNSGGVAIKWGATTYASLATWRAAVTGQEVSGGNVGLTSDPLLVTPGTMPTVTSPTVLTGANGLDLQGSSPMIDAGLDLPTLFGTSIGTVDYFGHTLMAPYSVGASDVTPAAPKGRVSNQTALERSTRW